ncbi:MAG: DUF1156 domain-containing protein [Pseudomonadales bacterium]|nr:DUF1156 domain-containing protein [Pseudomonadales bacterium]
MPFSLNQPPVSGSIPTFYEVPETQQRLIDAGLMHVDASLAGSKERHARGETSHTLQVWWARRPHSAMRSLVFASLCKTQNAEMQSLLATTACSLIGDEDVLSACEKTLLQQYGYRPKLLDMFGGGGTIPLEGSNLGAAVHASDINELSVFIQQCHLELVPSRDINRLKPLIEDSGLRILERLRQVTLDLYPLRQVLCTEETLLGPITYLWSYSTACSTCNYRFSLSRRPWLSRTRKRSLRLTLNSQAETQTLSMTHDQDIAKPSPGARFSCPRCGQPIQPNIAECRDELMALVLKNKGAGKSFALPKLPACPDREFLNQREQDYLQKLDQPLPASPLPRWSGIVNPALYGMKTHADVMNPRQRVVLLALIHEIRMEYLSLSDKLPVNEARFILGILSGLIDQMIDWNCRLSMWIAQNEQVGRAFCGPGIAMLWDYAEADPLLSGPGNLWSKLQRMLDGLDALALRRGTAKVQLASARQLPYTDAYFDAIVTDPPYYDNMYYSILADFFYAWKRMLFTPINPALFAASTTARTGTEELVASRQRSGSQQLAHANYCSMLTDSLREAARVLKPYGVMSFVYTHASLGGWLALIHAFRLAPLIICSAQPLCIERKARPRAMGSLAVNTCIAFIARRQSQPKSPITLQDIIKKFSTIICQPWVDELLDLGWSSNDTAMAVYAQAVAMLAGSLEITDSSDTATLAILEHKLQERFPEFHITRRASL